MHGSRRGRWIGRTLAVVLTLATTRAAADPPIHLQTSAEVKTDGGSQLRLPPGYFLDEPAWSALDTELRRLQDAETRLAAENTSLRASARTTTPTSPPSWYVVVSTFATGVAVGWYVHSKL